MILFERFFIPKTDKGKATIEFCGLLRYAYRYVSWDSGIADDIGLQDAFRKAMNATDDAAKSAAIMEALVVARLRVVR